MHKIRKIAIAAWVGWTALWLMACQSEPEIEQEPPEEILEQQEVMSIISLDMPLSFSIEEVGTEEEENPNQIRYVNEHYPEDLSNIHFEKRSADVKMSLLTADIIKKQTEDYFKTVYFEEVAVEITAFRRKNIDGNKAILVSTEYTLNDVNVVRSEYTITVGDFDYSITYTDARESGWQEVFEKSMNTIHIISDR